MKVRDFYKGKRMRMKYLISMAALLLAFNVTAFAADEVSMHEVYQAAEAGKLNEAQAMMAEVLRAHPDSARAHYVEAELLAKQGKLAAASEELSNAEKLKPGLPFVKPQSVQELRALIAGGSSSLNNGRPQEAQSGFGVGSVLLILALIVFIFFVGRAMGRRSNPVVYPANNGGNFGQQPYGSGMPMGGPMGGGMGSGILGGLATGAALGAGMVAGEELMRHFTDGDKTSGGVVSNANAGDSWSDSNDLGGNDFGVTDSGSWDDGGGGDWT